MNHRVGRIVFALVVGFAVAITAYNWITNEAQRTERAEQETVVLASRELLASVVASDTLEIVDPLAPNRRVGKVYIFAEAPGWAVSGYYRRNSEDRWHPFLLTMTTELKLKRLKVQDPSLRGKAASNPALEIIG